ncbi:hypothetical protein [Metabacillus fastidiosus]|uniref:hypothetical protein n=1 Tax=Metabacillus fastidiosus TaxID=1458 RepID=UPI000A9BDD63|nr:hypothetical protein [Metabacillus fastidiosus]MED4461280.1 hypothetical protein [Metabacillus fastidiosus]
MNLQHLIVYYRRKVFFILAGSIRFELTEEQQGLMTGLMVGGTAGAARIIDKGVPNFPYSKEYVEQQIQKGQAILKDMGRASYRQLEQIKEGGKKAAEVIGREIKKVDLFPII